MPKFDIKQKDSVEVAKATFDKKEDFMVVRLLTKSKDDKGKETMVEGSDKLLHVIQAKRLISKGKAVEVKGSKLEEREVEAVVTPEKAE